VELTLKQFCSCENILSSYVKIVFHPTYCVQSHYMDDSEFIPCIMPNVPCEIVDLIHDFIACVLSHVFH